MHISFIAMIMRKLTKKLPINQIIVDVIIIMLLFFYCGVCGFVISALRATIMMTFVILCDSIGEKNDLINSLLISLIIVILINPFNLLNVGCLLSYTSVLGLIILVRPVKTILKIFPKIISESLSVSISATIMSMPITFYIFGTFTPMAILYNLVMVPLVYIVFLLIIICLITTIIVKKLILYNLVAVLLKFIDKILILVRPEKFILQKTVNYYFMYIYYGFVFTFSDLTFLKIKSKTIISLLLLVISIGMMFI